MSRRNKSSLTPLSRLLLFLLIFLPTVFFGVSYAQGEDPIATLKGWFGGDSTPTEQSREERTSNNSTFDANERIQNLQQEIKNLRQRLDNKDRRIDELSKELEALKE